MIEESGRVVAVESGAVWVETIRQSSCASCSAQKGCGHSVLAQASRRHTHIRALTSTECEVGDGVVIGVPEDVVVTGSLVAYLLPLITLITATIVADALGAGDGVTALAGVAGLGAGFVLVYGHFLRHRRDPRYQPVVLRFAQEMPVKICSAETSSSLE